MVKMGWRKCSCLLIIALFLVGMLSGCAVTNKQTFSSEKEISDHLEGLWARKDIKDEDMQEYLLFRNGKVYEFSSQEFFSEVVDALECDVDTYPTFEEFIRERPFLATTIDWEQSQITYNENILFVLKNGTLKTEDSIIYKKLADDILTEPNTVKETYELQVDCEESLRKVEEAEQEAAKAKTADKIKYVLEHTYVTNGYMSVDYTFAEGISIVFASYEWDFEETSTSDVYYVTFSGTYRPNPKDLPSLVYNDGWIEYKVDINEGSVELSNDPYDMTTSIITYALG